MANEEKLEEQVPLSSAFILNHNFYSCEWIISYTFWQLHDPANELGAFLQK